MKKIVVIATVAVLVAVAFFVWWRRDTKPPHKKADVDTVHANAIDRADVSASMITILNAPEGATPCDTAWLAVEAEQAATKLRKGKSLFTWVAPKADFLAACQALPPDVQKCMAPRYHRDHTDECLRKKPADDVLKKMFVQIPQATD